MFTDNILSVFDSAALGDLASGMFWYADAHALANELSPGDVWRGAGVIAAFSPVCPWDRNVMLAREAFRTGNATGHTKAMCGQAQRILDGEHTLDVLNGDKVRAFASAIATNGKSDVATIDRHAYDIAMGKVFADKERKIGRRVFREMSAAYNEAARLRSIETAEMQAVTWVVWRKMKGVK